MTQKTVEMHLSNAYRKLDVHSRGELAKRLEGEAVPGSSQRPTR